MSLNRNAAANLAGRIWTAALGIVLIPIYVNVLGMESYALVGFFATLLSLFSIIDFGLGAAFSREVARLSAVEGNEQEQRDLLATFNVIYWILAVLIAAAIWPLAPLIATKWVHASKLSTGTIIMAVRLMGAAIALQFPTGLYQGGLLGLQRQVEYNVILVAMTTVRGLGAMIVLWYISPTIEAFFIWQVVLTCLTVAANWIALDRAVPRGGAPARIRLPLIRGVWGYAAGWAGNTVGIAIAQQTDKVIVSKMLPLEQFGYYTLAGTVASFLWTLVVPVSQAAFPRFNQRVALGDEAGLADDYDKANQLLATIIVPVCAIVLFFSRDLVTVWTRKPVIAAATAHLVVLFALGMTLVGLVNVALHVALSYGWFRLTLGFTWGTALVSVPFFWFASRWWGTTGAAAVWCAQNAAYLLLIPILHRRYIRGAGGRWLRHALVIPFAIAVMICGGMRLVIGSFPNAIITVLVLGTTWAVATALVALSEPDMRQQMFTLRGRLALRPDHEP